MTEQAMYRKFVVPDLYRRGLFFRRVEQTKMPDLYIAGNRRVLWAELKISKTVSGLIFPEWRPGQLTWIKEHIRKVGEESVVLILYHEMSVYYLEPKRKYEKKELVCKKNLYLKNLQR